MAATPTADIRCVEEGEFEICERRIVPTMITEPGRA